jgi:hypothetical protein
MPTRLVVPWPELPEERRLLAETVADLHYVLSLVVYWGEYLLPGESVEEMRSAWQMSEQGMATLVQRLIPSVPPSGEMLPDAAIVGADLTGAVGKVKRSMLGRLRDSFLMYWNSEPRTEEKRAKAGEAGANYFEFGATLVSSIPGQEKIVELLSLGRQLLGVRARRSA